MGPVQEYVAPEALELPLIMTAAEAQVSVFPVALAVGAVVFCDTEDVPVLVQPVEVFVIVTVYVPAAPTTGFCCVEVKPFGPIQLNVAGEALVVVFSVTEAVVQVNCPLGVIATVGGCMVLDAVVEAVAVQPFPPFATSNV